MGLRAESFIMRVGTGIVILAVLVLTPDGRWLIMSFPSMNPFETAFIGLLLSGTYLLATPVIMMLMYAFFAYPAAKSASDILKHFTGHKSNVEMEWSSRLFTGKEEEPPPDCEDMTPEMYQAIYRDPE